MKCDNCGKFVKPEACKTIVETCSRALEDIVCHFCLNCWFDIEYICDDETLGT